MTQKPHSMSRIHSFYIAGESIKTKVQENSTPLAITHVNDFEYNFPNVDLSPFSTSKSGSWTLYGAFACVCVCVCVCVCYFFLSCAVLSLFAFLISLSFEW